MRRRALFAAVAIAAWVAGAALGTTGGPAQAQATPLLAIGKAHAGSTPSLTGDAPVFILAIGSDARVDDGTPPERGLGDSIHIIGINPVEHQASILGFPRDSYVPTACAGTGKINNTLAAGGPACVVETIEDLTGITMDYYVLTWFDGVKDAVDDIGRLTLQVPFTMNDPLSKSDFEPGTYDLKGSDVLAFSRDRHSFMAGDFARSENQGRVLIAALTQFRKEFAEDPSRLLDWIGVGSRNIETDLSLQELMDFGFTATTFNPKKVQNMVVPGGIGTAGGASIVNISSQANAIYADMKQDGIVEKKNVPKSPTANEK